jgi:hypothetical protein
MQRSVARGHTFISPDDWLGDYFNSPAHDFISDVTRALHVSGMTVEDREDGAFTIWFFINANHMNSFEQAEQDLDDAVQDAINRLEQAEDDYNSF